MAAPSNTDLLTAAYRNALTRLAEMDLVPVSERAKMSYSDGEQSYGWNEFRAALLAQVTAYPDQLIKLLAAQQAAAPPFTVLSGG